MSDSPCIDSGNPEYLDPDNTRSDIGAVFYDQLSEECSMPGDINNDGIVNVLDVVEIINFVLSSNEDILYCYDVNNDGTVNILDIVNTINIILGD